MAKGLRWVDAAGAWGLVLLGCVHNFIAAPASFDAVDADLFEFVAAGLALWYAGAANVVRQLAPSRAAIFSCAAVDLTLLAYVVAFGLHNGELTRPGGMFLVALVATETAFALGQAVGLVSARTQSA